MTFVIGVAAVLVIAILILMFRIHTLLNVLRGSYRTIGGVSNKINAILFPIVGILGFGLFFWYSSVAKDEYLLPLASVHGKNTDFMFWLIIWILIVAFVITHIFLLAFIVRYQYNEKRKAFFYPENHRLEFVWTIIPAIVMAVLVYYGWNTWSEIFKAPPANKTITIEVMGKQFNWQVRYPGKDTVLGAHSFKKIDLGRNPFGLIAADTNGWDDFMPNEIHIPVNTPVMLKIRAQDVLHSVYLPHFRVKMDAVPGMPTQFWFTATKTTAEMRKETGKPGFNYELACAELCGRGHYSMRFILVVEEMDAYQKWYNSQKTFADSQREYILENIPENLKGLLPGEKVAADTTKQPTPQVQADTTVNNEVALNGK